MREYLKITAGGLIVALAVVPAFAQTGARPQSTQQAPRNQSGTSASTSTDSSGMTNQSTNQNTTTDSTTGTMSRDSATGTMSNDSMRGMRGSKASKADVLQLQGALKAQGQDPGPIDGAIGPQTQEAIRAYQRSQSLTETGELDQQTADRLGVRGGMSHR